MPPEKEMVNSDGYDEEVHRKLEVKRNALAVLFGSSSIPTLPKLAEDTLSTLRPEAKDGVVGRTTTGRGPVQRRGSTSKLLSNFMPDINEINSVAKSKNFSLHRQTSQERISRTRSNSETMTISEEEETLRAFTKSRRTTRRRTSASRGSRGGEGQREDEAPHIRALLRRRSTRFSLTGQEGGDVGGSSSSMFGRRGSMNPRMSDWRRISLLVKQQEELKEIQKKEEVWTII